MITIEYSIYTPHTEAEPRLLDRAATQVRLQGMAGATAIRVDFDDACTQEVLASVTAKLSTAGGWVVNRAMLRHYDTFSALCLRKPEDAGEALKKARELFDRVVARQQKARCFWRAVEVFAASEATMAIGFELPAHDYRKDSARRLIELKLAGYEALIDFCENLDRSQSPEEQIERYLQLVQEAA